MSSNKKCKVLTVGIPKDKPRRETLVTLKIAYEPSQRQRDAKPRAGIERTSPEKLLTTSKFRLWEKKAILKYRYKKYRTTMNFRRRNKKAMIIFQHREYQAKTRFHQMEKRETIESHHKLRQTMMKICLKTDELLNVFCRFWDPVQTNLPDGGNSGNIPI